MEEQKAREFLKNTSKSGSVPGLESIRNLLWELGNPQDKLAFIHIAGTNGKGSTLAFLTAILKESGYKTGSFTSPIIEKYEEHFQINGIPMELKILVDCVEKVMHAVNKMTAKGMSAPTIFEVETAIAFLYFLSEGCDIVLLETGMGGDLDATNIIKAPLIAVFTPISMDHQDFLGHTLVEIATEKAGIIKKGTTVVSAPQDSKVCEILKERAVQKGCPFIKVETLDIAAIKEEDISLSGLYQKTNAATAMTVARVLQKSIHTISDASIANGLKKAYWPGRFETISSKPLVVIDGAHNPAGARALAKSIKFYFTNKRIIYIMGILKDKEYEKIVQETILFASGVYTITPLGERALDARVLLEEVKKYQENAWYADNLETAVRKSIQLAGEDGVVVAFGSLSFLGDIKREVKEFREKECAND